MQKITRSRSFLALGLFGLSLLPLMGAAHAQPRPGYGVAPERAANFGRVVTLEGVVTKARDGRDNLSRFRVEAGGKTFDVRSDANVRVRDGERVILRGTFSGDNDFNARAVEFYQAGTRSNQPRGGVRGGAYGNEKRGGVRGANPGFPYRNGGYSNADNRNDNNIYGDDYRAGTDNLVSFPGVVTRILGINELEVRGDNGRIYRVAERRDGREWQVGNRIRVEGSANGNRIVNARLSLQNGGIVGPIFGNNAPSGAYNNGGIFGSGNYGNSPYDNGDVFGGNFENGKKVDFGGRIVSIDRRAEIAIVRGDNGRNYSVRSKDLEHYNANETVRVQGKVSGGVIDASDIDHTY